MKTFAALAILGLVSATEKHHYPVNFVALSESEGSSSSSSSSGSDEEDLALEDFHPGLDRSNVFKDGAGDATASFVDPHGSYYRVIPSRFSADSDDIFIRSMLTKYAMEGEHDADDCKKGLGPCGPTGAFYVSKPITKAIAEEVLATHKGLTGAALQAYLAAYLDKAFAHFDVNQTGSINALRMAEFMRFLASDQYMSLG
jgi:hypothetical protein